MEKIDALNQVAAFHRTFQHPVLDDPVIPSETRCKLRVALLQEELDEFKAAIADKDIVEVADALCDMQYVLAGAILEFGLGEKFVELFNEVQRSNMSKACATQEEAEATQQYYLDRDGTQSYIRELNGQWLVYRQGDDKTLKSVNYSPADLEGILDRTTEQY
jgi:predicted HAD superfamily Cof-like phosphohydrolase